MNLLSNYGASEIIWMRENWTNDTSNPSDQSQFGYKFYERYVILTIFIPILVLAVLGNISVILSFCKDKRLRTPTNFPLISLSISDLLVASFTFPLSIVYKLTGRWYFGNAMCIVWLCSDYIATSTSVLSLIIVTFDRYMTITKFQKYKHNVKNVMRMISLAWLIPTITYVPITVVWPYIGHLELTKALTKDYNEIHDPNGYICDEGWRSLTPFLLFTTIMFTYMPLASLIFFNAQIYLMIKANAEKLKQTELMSAPQVELPEIIIQEPTVVLAANEESKINMQLIDYSDDYSDTSSGSRISTTGPQKNWELLRQKFKSSSKNKPIEVPLSRHGSQGRSKRHRQQQQRQLSTESQNVSTNASVPTSMGSSSGNAISVEINMPHGRSLRAQPERDDSVEHQMEEPGTSVVSFRPQRLQMFTLGSSMESNNSGLSVKSDPIIKLAPKLSEDEESPTYKSPRESPVGSISSDMSRGKVHFQREMKPNRNFKSMRNSMKKPSRRMIKRLKKKEETLDTGSDSDFDNKDKITTVSASKKGNKSRHLFTQCSHETGQRQLRRHHRNKRIFKLIVILVSIYISCWCPYSIIACLDSVFKLHIPSYLFDCSVWVLYFNSCLNPVLYVWRNRAFRTALANLYKMRASARLPYR